MVMDGISYRKKKSLEPLMDEDSDHYGYNDSNAEYKFDKMMNMLPPMGITYRKHKKESVRIVRKKKHVKKTCTCKK